MTVVETHIAECGDCGNVELLKFSLTSASSFIRIPDMNFSNSCS